MTDRMDTEALRALLERATPGPWAFEAHGDTGDYGVGLCFAEDDEDCKFPLSGKIESNTIVEDPVAVEVKGSINAQLVSLAPALAAEVLELREALAACAPALAMTHATAKECFDEYELTIDHFGDLVERLTRALAAAEARNASEGLRQARADIARLKDQVRTLRSEVQRPGLRPRRR